MGFYGNITNINRTSFTFDKVYPNRYLMDQHAAGDSVFLGRYVLVEYDIETKKEDYLIEGVYPEENTEGKTPYEINYLIDKTQYGATSRLYDSTVWQKVYTDDGERYVMIAELNSVVPSLHLTIDKPTEGKPGLPSFSEESNNIDYQLHWEPQWGFKVGSIAFNEAGFDKHNANAEVGNPNDRIYFTKEKSGTQYPVYATDPATGTRYVANTESADDIQVLNIDLPSIGNMVSKGYDIIYGENRDNSPSGSLQGYLNFFTTSIKNNEIPVRSASGAMVGATVTDDAWINTTVDAASKSIQIVHADATNNQTTATAAVTSDTIDLYTPQVDAKGHVTGSITTTTTLPYGYKTITTNGRGTNRQVNGSTSLNKDNVSAKNTVDTLALNSANPWIRIDTDAQNNTVTFAHSVYSIDIENKGDTNLNADDATGTIRVHDIMHDAAGHITSNQRHNYILPYGYKKINSGVASSNTENGVSNSENIVASNAKDEFTIAPGNKWILTSANADSKTLTLAHEVHSIDSNPIEQHTALDSANGTITIKDIEFDSAGHAISNKNHIYDLPFAIRNIQVNSSNATAIGVNSTGTIEADKYNDTLILSTQNRWITLKANPATDAIIIGHAEAGTEKTTAGDTAAATPAFGSSFNIPYVKYDETGHIASSGVRSVTIPQGSLTKTTSTSDTANVLTAFDFTATTGALAIEQKNIGTLKLTGYAPVGDDDKYIQYTDSINGAFKKVDTRIDSINTALTNRINALDYTDTTATDKVIYGLTQTDGKISLERKAVGELIISGYLKPVTDAGQILSSDSLNTALGKLEFGIGAEAARSTTEEGKIRNEFAAADTTITNNLNQEIERATKAEEALEKRIDTVLGGVTETELNTLKELSDALNDDADYAGTITKAISKETEDREKADELLQKQIDAFNADDNGKVAKAAAADTANSLTDSAKAEVKAIKVDNATTADQASGLNAAGIEVIKSVKINDATNADKLGNIVATDYALKTEVENQVTTARANAENYADSLASNYATAEQGQQIDAITTTIKTYGDIVTYNANEFATSQQIAEKNQEIYTLNSRCNVLDTEVKNLINTVAKLQQTIQELQSKLAPESNE